MIMPLTMKPPAMRTNALTRWLLLPALLLCLLSGRSVTAGEASAPPAAIGQVTFFYYEDLDDAAHFYGNVMGFEKTADRGWVKFFAITPTSSVAIVDGTKGFHRVSDDKPVMLSVITDDVDSWYQHLRGQEVRFIKHLDDGSSPEFLRAFLVEDPGGYTVEVYEWR
ncbi:VOC family protein [Chromatocurvus halotolerans]|uniref:Glyoxalase/bleomycin resistance protein/dioxygenase superfamily protein n=1 Tax=Chromatocurvus halotolerans TaxID=1132028 RepID=A0A4R2KPY2_9GAMM|nr:VOC family protein [Chromatocurvus halotolerans]TCO76301.1 glyoxalase/bleomycin resistance protein/dioxygenase superfamily protein [Chromatocurvus halotolerans]